MNTTELIEIAKECCFSRQVVGDETALITFRSEQLQQLAQRIKQPLQDRITEITVKSYNGLNDKNRQIEQLREALQDFSDYVRNEQMSTDGPVNYSNTQINRLVFKARKALEETK